MTNKLRLLACLPESDLVIRSKFFGDNNHYAIYLLLRSVADGHPKIAAIATSGTALRVFGFVSGLLKMKLFDQRAKDI